MSALNSPLYHSKIALFFHLKKKINCATFNFMCYKLLSSFGLITDIAGVILLFIYGLPSKIVEPSKRLLEGSVSEADQKKNAFIKKMSYLGLTLLIIGFTLQLVSIWSNYICS